MSLLVKGWHFVCERTSSQAVFAQLLHTEKGETAVLGFKWTCQKTDDSRNLHFQNNIDISKKEWEESWEQKGKRKKREERLFETSLKRPLSKFAFVYVQAVILLETGIVFWERGKWCEQNSTGHRDSCTLGTDPEEVHPRCCLPILLHGMNICRVLLSINTRITGDTLIPFAGAQCNDYSRRNLKKASINLTVSQRIFHTWLVIFTPGFDICVSFCFQLSSN